MNREDLRVVEFTVVETTKAKKGKKSQKKARKFYGFFHLWGTNVNGKGNEKFFGLVEEAVTGSLLEVSYKDIRFLSEAEIEDYHEAQAGFEEAAEEAPEVEEITETHAAETEAAAQPEAEAPAEPKTTRTRKPKA